MSNPARRDDSLLGAAENIGSKVHGAAESLTGAFNAGIDQAVHGKSLEKDRGKINRGQEEWNTGHHVPKQDRHYEIPSNMEKNEGRVAHHPGDPTIVDRRPGAHSGGDAAFEGGTQQVQPASMHDGATTTHRPKNLTMDQEAQYVDQREPLP